MAGHKRFHVAVCVCVRVHTLRVCVVSVLVVSVRMSVLRVLHTLCVCV